MSYANGRQLAGRADWRPGVVPYGGHSGQGFGAFGTSFLNLLRTLRPSGQRGGAVAALVCGEGALSPTYGLLSTRLAADAPRIAFFLQHMGHQRRDTCMPAKWRLLVGGPPNVA